METQTNNEEASTQEKLDKLIETLKTTFLVSGTNPDGGSQTLLQKGLNGPDANKAARKSYNFKKVESCQSIGKFLGL
tara:strand:+ start:5896 stop:6126 length:231 start_codon:yes stop_codon:yes gene_type:complete